MWSRGRGLMTEPYWVEVRCPLGNKRLFGKLLVDPALKELSPRIVEGNLVEFACAECRKLLASKGEDVARVLHQYNIMGELVRSRLVRHGDT